MFRLFRYLLFFFAFLYVWYAVKKITAAFLRPKRHAPPAPPQPPPKPPQPFFPPSEIKDAEFEEVK